MATSAPSDQTTVVLAGTYSQFLYWCRENKRNPRDRSVRFAGEIQHLRGLTNIHFVTYGTWGDRRDALEIFTYVRHLERTGRATWAR